MAALTISLTLSPEVAAAFQSAQADRSVRSLILTIAEERFHLDSTNAAAGDVAADFESLAATLSDSEPRFVIFCVDPDDAVAALVDAVVSLRVRGEDRGREGGAEVLEHEDNQQAHGFELAANTLPGLRNAPAISVQKAEERLRDG